jgi:pimeloyl-ACP methyl ester carboxylesterase
MTTSTIQTITSNDGTRLAAEVTGSGPAIVLVCGGSVDRGSNAGLAAVLATDFTVWNFDRRGRGDSGDTAPYAVEREIDDLAALIRAAGGSAAVFGHSSGATLALKAAASGLPITHLVLYEPPFNPDDSFPRLPAGLAGELAGLVADGRRGDAVELYQTRAVGMPEEVVAQLRNAPFRPALEAIAHTLAYDAAVIGDRSLPAAMLATITIPALVITGEQSPPFLTGAAKAAAAALPAGQLAVLPGQTHDINPEATAPVIASFLS